MNDTISWNLRLQIADGKLDDVKALADEMSEATRLDEPGGLAYEWFIPTMARNATSMSATSTVAQR